MQDLIATPWLVSLLAGTLVLVGVVARLLSLRPAVVRPTSMAPPGTALAAVADVVPGSEHWLRDWLSDVSDPPRLELEHEREFAQSPNTVVAALVQVLAAEGHIDGIEGYGTVVVFSPHRCRMASGRQLRARVHRRGGRTVLEVTSDAPAPATLADRQSECVQVHHVLTLLSQRLHGSALPGRAGALAR